MSSMFEQAARNAYRFESKNGSLTTEDLWNLPLTSSRGSNLDDVAKVISREIKKTEEESFVSTASKSDNDNIVKLDIVKYIIKVKLQESKDKVESKTLYERKQKIMRLIDEKKDDELKGKSVEELTALL